MVTEPDVRLTIINAVLRDVITKEDLERVREELKGEIKDVRKELSKLSDKVSDLASRIRKVESQLSLLIKVVFAVNAQYSWA